MQTIRRVFFASLFFLTVVVLAFCLYGGMGRAVRTLNQGVSSWYDPDGNFQSRPYPRFVPWNYELGVTLGIDFGVSMLCASALFYGVLLVSRRKRRDAPAEDLTPAPGKATGKDFEQSARLRRRLLLIPVWLVAQYLWNLFSGMSAGQALDMMTSIESLWYSAVVITVIVLYARNYQVVFGKEPKQP